MLVFSCSNGGMPVICVHDADQRHCATFAPGVITQVLVTLHTSLKVHATVWSSMICLCSGSLWQALLDCLLYKLSYYRFADAAMLTTGRRGFDRVRNVEIGNMDIKLNYFTEVFTSEHWMVRIYKVNDR